jgi:hypothetical protein
VTVLALTLAAGALLGYLAGRVRPLDRLDTWVWRRLAFGGAWINSRPQQVLTLTVHALVRPCTTVRIWRHRKAPPPDRSAPLRFRPHAEEPDGPGDGS